MKKVLLFLMIVVCWNQAVCQYQIGLVPRVSPDKSVYQKVGFTEIEIKYGSPRVNDRTIWGGLEAYDIPWRAGANNATTIRFSETVHIEGNYLKAGTYAFFIIPRQEGKWTLIFSENEKQWGAFSYKEEEDALRIEIEPKEILFQEDLNYELKGDLEVGTVCFKWEKVGLIFEIKTDPIKGFKRIIEEKFESAEDNIKFVVLIQGAEFLVEQNKSLDLALNWLDTSIALQPQGGEWNKQFYPKPYLLGHLYWVRAKLFALKKDYDKALLSAKRMKEITTKYNFYHRKKEDEKIDENIELWTSQKNK